MSSIWSAQNLQTLRRRKSPRRCPPCLPSPFLSSPRPRPPPGPLLRPIGAIFNPSIRIEGSVGVVSNPPYLPYPPDPPSGTLRSHQSSGSDLRLGAIEVAGIIRIVVLRSFTRLPLRRQAARDAAAPRLGLALVPRPLRLDLVLVHAHDQVAQQTFRDLEAPIELAHEIAAAL